MDRKQWTGQQVAQALAGSSYFAMQHIIVDSKYDGLKLDDWKTVIQTNHDNNMQYVSEFRDCDDFAFKTAADIKCNPANLPLNGIGVVLNIQAEHAYNFLLVDDGNDLPTIQVFEPQTHQFKEPIDEHIDKDKHTPTGYTII